MGSSAVGGEHVSIGNTSKAGVCQGDTVEEEEMEELLQEADQAAAAQAQLIPDVDDEAGMDLLMQNSLEVNGGDNMSSVVKRLKEAARKIPPVTEQENYS